jgi:hypothetical protein
MLTNVYIRIGNDDIKMISKTFISLYMYREFDCTPPNDSEKRKRHTNDIRVFPIVQNIRKSDTHAAICTQLHLPDAYVCYK